jgi:hypothetical protein
MSSKRTRQAPQCRCRIGIVNDAALVCTILDYLNVEEKFAIAARVGHGLNTAVKDRRAWGNHYHRMTSKTPARALVHAKKLTLEQTTVFVRDNETVCTKSEARGWLQRLSRLAPTAIQFGSGFDWDLLEAEDGYFGVVTRLGYTVREYTTTCNLGPIVYMERLEKLTVDGLTAMDWQSIRNLQNLVSLSVAHPFGYIAQWTPHWTMPQYATQRARLREFSTPVLSSAELQFLRNAMPNAFITLDRLECKPADFKAASTERLCACSCRGVCDGTIQCTSIAVASHCFSSCRPLLS